MKNIPNLDPLFDEVVAYVKEHQGEKGYIDCQPFSDEMSDIIYGFIYEDFSGVGEEKYVYAVRWNEEWDDLEVLLEDITRTYRVVYKPEDFTSKDNEDKWHSLRWSDVYYIPTLFNIAECIEEYVED